MVGHFDAKLVALSICIAILSIYSAQTLGRHLTRSRGWVVGIRVLAAAMSLGAGVWAMHLIGLLALRLPIVIVLDVDSVLTSLLVSLVASMAVMPVFARRTPPWRRRVTAAMALGIGSTAAQYLDLAAIQVSPAITYDPFLAALSGITAVVGLLAAFNLLHRLQRMPSVHWMAARLAGACATAAALAISHFTAMAAARFAPNALCTVTAASISPMWLAVIIAAGVMLVLAIAVFSSVFEGHLVSSTRRLNEALRRANEELLRVATHDVLTGLPNRSLLGQRIDEAIRDARTDQTRKGFALVFVDLDRFKSINDTLGHHVGDQLLCQVSQRMAECLRRSDTLARLAGDEFVILLRDVPQAEQALDVVSRVRSALAGSIHVQGRPIRVTATFGISLYPLHGGSADELMVSADAAMYRGKQQGRDTHQMFEPRLASFPPGSLAS